MVNNTFFIVYREKDMKGIRHDLPNRDRWGWGFVDLIERTSYEEAKKDLAEYRLAMPNFLVLIRNIRVGETWGRPGFERL